MKKTSSWIIDSPIDAVVFDCDGTLSKIEGIDELAALNGVGELITRMTQTAMAKTGLSEELYNQRLELVKPKEKQVLALADAYFQERTEDAAAIIQTFRRLNKAVYIISAGVNPAVEIFGRLLGVSPENIKAVDLRFDQQGNYLDFDHDSPLVRKNGKRQVIQNIQQQHQRLLFIGDGINDTEAMDLVTRFVGYGGNFYRENIAAKCEFYLRELTLSPLLALTLTAAECEQLTGNEKNLLSKGIAAFEKYYARVCIDEN